MEAPLSSDFPALLQDLNRSEGNQADFPALLQDLRRDGETGPIAAGEGQTGSLADMCQMKYSPIPPRTYVKIKNVEIPRKGSDPHGLRPSRRSGRREENVIRQGRRICAEMSDLFREVFEKSGFRSILESAGMERKCRHVGGRRRIVKTFFLFGLLWALLGNPFAAILVLLVVLYVLERRFIGLSPSIVRPFRRRSAIAKWKRQLHMSPHDVSAKNELARLLIENRSYAEAREILLGIREVSEHSAEFWNDLGTCELALGRLEEGDRAMRKALAISPRVKYGQPYLRLAEAWSKKDPAKALADLEAFREVNSSSCEAYYRLGTLYAELGKQEEAASAFRECRELYAALPAYLKRKERKWYLLSLLRGQR